MMDEGLPIKARSYAIGSHPNYSGRKSSSMAPAVVVFVVFVVFVMKMKMEMETSEVEFVASWLTTPVIMRDRLPLTAH